MTEHRQQYEAYGVAFGLGASSPLLLRLATAELPYGSEARTAAEASGDSLPEYFVQENESGTAYRLLLDGDTVMEWQDRAAVLARLRGDLMIHVANYAPDFVFVHAGVIGWQGQALLFPGPSFAGKSTLVSELVRAGAVYYSDEYAVVDEQGLVHPYARDLQMRRRSGGAAQSGVAVEALGGLSGTELLRVGGVFFCEYAEDAEWLPQPVSPGMAVLEMLRHSISIQRTPARVMSVLTRMMDGASAQRTQRGDAAETAQKLLSPGTVAGMHP